MSLCDLDNEINPFSQLTHSYSPSELNTIFNIATEPDAIRTPKEKEALTDFLCHVNTINQTMKNIVDFKTYILQLSDCIKALSLTRGTPLVLRGQKCNEVFIILDGRVNVYDSKDPKEIIKQKQEFLEAIHQKKPKLASQATLGFNIRRRGLHSMTRREIQTSPNWQDMDSGVMSDRKTLTIKKSKIKIKASATFMCSKPSKISDFSELDHNYEHLPESEQVLLEDAHCRRKYFKQGACLLSLKDNIGAAEIINEKCLFQDYRSPVTIVANDDVKCIKLSKEIFLDILKDEIKSFEEKKEYFFKFFEELRRSDVVQISRYIKEKCFKMHEKIYIQGDASEGIYFVKRGGEVKLQLALPQKNKENDEKDAGTHPDYFLPNQHRAQRKHTLTVGIISKGDFFGEESMVMEEGVRKYTAISASDELVLYYMAPEFYLVILDICPEVFNILRERTEQRNYCIEEKIKAYESMKEKAKELFQLNNSSSKSLIQNLIISNTKQRLELSHNKIFISKGEDYIESRIPSNFASPRENDGAIAKQGTESNEQKEFETPSGSNKSSRPETKAGAGTKSVKSLELPFQFKFIEQEKGTEKKNFGLKNKGNQKRESITMTGLKKDQAYVQLLQNLVIKQSNIFSSPKHLRISASDVLAVGGKSVQIQPDFKKQTEPANRLKSRVFPTATLDISSYTLNKDEGFGSPNKALSHRPMNGEVNQLIDWPIRTQSQTHMRGGFLTCRHFSNEKSKPDSINELDSMIKTQKKHLVTPRSLNQIPNGRVVTEPNFQSLQLNIVASKQTLNNVRPNSKAVCLSSKNVKAGNLN